MTPTQLAARPATLSVHNPANQQSLGEVPQFNERSTLAAVDLARAAQPRWAATPVAERLRILREFRKILWERKDAVAAVITGEAGKPRSEALSTEVLVVLDTVGFLLEQVPIFLRPEEVPHGNLVMKLKHGYLLREP